MQIDKVNNASRNIVFGTILKIYQVLLPFIMRTIMMYTIGVEYLGLNSLFTSVLQVLNLAELGVGSAMVFSMYKPIAEDDTATICALMKLYKHYYRIIGSVILVIGLILTPSIPRLISGSVPYNINIYVLYLLNLSATVLTYWLFAYRNSVLQAHQRNDIASKITIITDSVKYAFQIAALVLFHNYYLYIIFVLFTQVINNVLVAMASRKLYPNYNPCGKLPEEIVNSINGKIKDLFTSKLGHTIVASADTIVISAFLGLTVLAQYQNYYYIMSSIISFMSIIYSSITAGVGNSMLIKTKKQNYGDFKTFTLLVTFVSGLCISCFLNLYQPFMKMWMGNDMLLPYSIVILLCVYFWFYELVMMISVYKDAGGIWHQDRFRPLIAGVVNLILNLVLVRIIGLYGIVLSTIISQVLVSLPWIVRNVHTLIFNNSSKEYFWIIGKNTIKIFGVSAIVYGITYTIPFNGFLEIILKGLVTLCLTAPLLIIVFMRDEQFDSAKVLIFRLLKVDKLKKR